MKETNSFAVGRFENRNGIISWRVAGWLQGVRIRKNFKFKEEAAAEKAALDLKALQINSDLRAATTCLSEDQVREAEAVFHRLTDNPKSLSFYLDFALANYRDPISQQTLKDAVKEYVAVKTREQAQRLISSSQLTTIERHLKVLQRHYPAAKVADLSATQLTTHCQRGNAGLKTYNNRRGVLSTFLKFARLRDWIATNPIEKVPYHRIAHRRGSAKTLTAAQAQELMNFVEGYHDGAFVPFFALCLFAGIRPACAPVKYSSSGLSTSNSTPV